MILSDRWIRAQCEIPTHILKKATGGIEYASAPFTELQTAALSSQEFLSKLNVTSSFDGIEYGVNQIRPITQEELSNWKPMIAPYVSKNVRSINDRKIISYGTSSYGYDVRCSDEFKIFTNINSSIVDPKDFDEKSFVSFKGDVCIIPPNSFALARTIERFKIPRNVLTICLGKSTYARCGIIVNVTPLEPEWEGYVTLEFSNTTNLPAKIYANEGVAQMLFLEGNEECLTSYADRGGKYQNQEPLPVIPKI